MISTAIIIFREALEIAMIVGIVLAATRGLPGRGKWIALGFAGGTAGAAMVAVFAGAISNSLEGMGQELFNALILFTAAIFIGWTVIWMRSHAKDMVAELREIGKNVSQGSIPRYALSLIIGLAMLREGAEIVLFVYGMALSGQTISAIATGCVLGLTLGVAAGCALYVGLIIMSARYMLSFTSWLLILLVAGLAAQGARFLASAGYFEHYTSTLWDTSWLLSDASLAGQTLHSLIGYSAQPTEIELIFYVCTLALLLIAIGLNGITSRKPALASV